MLVALGPAAVNILVAHVVLSATLLLLDGLGRPVRPR